MAVRRREDLLLGEPGREEVRLAAALDEKLRKLFGRSLRLRQVSAGGCNACEADTNVLGHHRLGPRPLRHPVRRLARATPTACSSPARSPRTWSWRCRRPTTPCREPKIVIAVGACAIAGGPFVGHSGGPQRRGGAGARGPVHPRLSAASADHPRRTAAVVRKIGTDRFPGHMNAKSLLRLGIPDGEPMRLAQEFVREAIARGFDGSLLAAELSAILADPAAYGDDELRGSLARAILRPPYAPRPEPAPWRQWGADLDEQAIQQMANACTLPVAVAGALMPDAHLGYGLPIGGVLATDNVVIPYAVGVDIACRMKLSVYDCPAGSLAGQRDRLAGILENETRFGVGATWEKRRDHEVMDDDWSVTPVTGRLRDKAWAQLGTSGSGNHFVEFGTFTADESQARQLGIEPGEYLALLSHSGVARRRRAGLRMSTASARWPATRTCRRNLRQLAWLPLDEADGQEYWAAMELMGRYAAANHALIHRHIARKMGAEVILDIENHHNFAWRETHVIHGEPREVIVHRKGATPAAAGASGVIPGSMATPGFIVRGKGDPESLHSAAHGAGRVMSRSKALQSFTWNAVRKLLAERGVELLSAGLDEVPGVYKDIHAVMAAQADLVEILGRFDPRLVKMCPAGERPED